VKHVSEASGHEKSVLLKPGEQAIEAGFARLTIDHSPDLDKVMAWKNGLFNFEGASFAEVMGQLERWYDIEIVYEKTVPDIEFEGKMTRDVPLHDLLKMLERSDIHFRIEGRKLIVLP
jgi:ferric-dicitrate binding protein FerR (iron transport regulator)